MKTFNVLLHLEDASGVQRDHVTSYIADTLESVDEMIHLDYGNVLLYWEEA